MVSMEQGIGRAWPGSREAVAWNCEPVDGRSLRCRATLGRMKLFMALGVLTLCYTFFAVARGEVHAKAGWRGRLILRTQSPRYFWTVIAIYAALGIALMTVF